MAASSLNQRITLQRSASDIGLRSTGSRLDISFLNGQLTNDGVYYGSTSSAWTLDQTAKVCTTPIRPAAVPPISEAV